MQRQSGHTSQQKGFSIVELMVSILIGLIILAGVVQVVITSRMSFMGQEEMSFIQENARYAVSVMGKDIQNAGHWGCAGTNAKVAMVGRVAANATDFMTFRALDGYEGDPTDTSAPAPPTVFGEKIRAAKDADDADIKPDSILVRALQGESHAVKSHIDGSLTLASDHSFKKDDYVGVIDGDCKRFGVFRAGGKNGNTITYGAAENAAAAIKPTLDESMLCGNLAEEATLGDDGSPLHGANCSGAPSSAQMYTNTATVMPYQASAFYIGDSTAFGNAMPALKRAVLKDGVVVSEEIALGVEDMQILYGEATDAAIQYRTADQVEEWAAVVSVQVNLLFRSQAPMLDRAKDFPFMENTYNDRFARQVVSSTFGLRNRI